MLITRCGYPTLRYTFEVSNVPLHEWQTPQQMQQATASLKAQLGNLAMRGPGQNFRDAFVACRFALFREADAVRLLEPRQQRATPDFAILFTGKELWFETTEADRPGRKRSREYSNGGPALGFIPDDEWVNPATYKAIVGERASAKCKKSYEKCDGLIIWSNAFPIEQDEFLTREWWQSAAEPAVHTFSETWVYFKQSFIELTNLKL